MSQKRPKRPRDPAQLAKLVIDIATGEVEDRNSAAITAPRENRKHLGGQKGGKARAVKLSNEQRAEIARAAAQARWKKG